MAGQPPRERQRIQERAGELEVEVLRVQLGVAQRHEPRVGGGQRREVAGHRAAALAEPQRIEPDLEHPPAV